MENVSSSHIVGLIAMLNFETGCPVLANKQAKHSQMWVLNKWFSTNLITLELLLALVGRDLLACVSCDRFDVENDIFAWLNYSDQWESCLVSTKSLSCLIKIEYNLIGFLLLENPTWKSMLFLNNMHFAFEWHLDDSFKSNNVACISIWWLELGSKLIGHQKW